MKDALAVAIRDRDLKLVIDLHIEAANRHEVSGNLDAACFLLTQAWIYALEAGDPRAESCRARLIQQGRESEV